MLRFQDSAQHSLHASRLSQPRSRRPIGRVGNPRGRQKGPGSVRRRDVSGPKGVRKVRIRYDAHGGYQIRVSIPDGGVEALGREHASESLRHHVEADRRQIYQRADSRSVGGCAAAGIRVHASREDGWQHGTKLSLVCLAYPYAELGWGVYRRKIVCSLCYRNSSPSKNLDPVELGALISLSNVHLCNTKNRAIKPLPSFTPSKA